ncbi:MAG TPA: hypothetical protein VD997_04265 [Phycisphaerales bacterium]|nr:hypothetical protein [Phycisphaerales bacterium]
MNLKSLKSKAAVLVAAAVVTGGLGAKALAQGQRRPEGERRERQPGNQEQRRNQDGGRDGGQGGGREGGGRGGFGRMGGGFMEGMMGSAVTSRQLEKYTTILGLTKDQQQTVKMLHEGYSEQAREVGEKAREEMRKLGEEMRDSEDREGLMEKMQKSMREVRETRRKQDESFANDVKAVLTPEQAEKWPAVERMQRREASMRRGFISGERVDLFALVNDNSLSAEAQKSAAPILSEYEVELDRELIKRNQWQEKQFSKMNELRREGDFEAIQKLVEEGRELDVKVRDVNRKYAKQIEGALPEGEKERFQTAFKRASFPDVYLQTQSDEAIEVALKLKDLTPEQREQVQALQASHVKALNPLNEKLAAAVEEAEMNFNVGQMGRGGFGRDEDSPAGKLRREKRDLDRTTMESLRKVLTAEQAEKLPRREERGGGGQRRRENVNEEN